MGATAWRPRSCGILRKNGEEQLARQALLQDDGDGVAYTFADGFAHVGVYWQLVGAVAQSHERAAKGMAIDLAANLYQAASAKKLYRGGPDNVNPATFPGTLSQLGGEFLVQAHLRLAASASHYGGVLAETEIAFC